MTRLDLLVGMIVLTIVGILVALWIVCALAIQVQYQVLAMIYEFHKKKGATNEPPRTWKDRWGRWFLQGGPIDLSGPS
jgi:hypothetical protein